MNPSRVLIIRLGAMGDILHALPAAASLRRSFPSAQLVWTVHPKWRDLLEGSGIADELIFFDRSKPALVTETWRRLRTRRFDAAIDFQGLVQSAILARLARSGEVLGFDSSLVRERPAAIFYTRRISSSAAHVVDRNLDLAAAVGASERAIEFPLPDGRPEGELPHGRFILASPLAGWAGKQWPLENYAELARRLRGELRVELVLNGAPPDADTLLGVENVRVHLSSIGGLIWATRRAAAVLGVDSGPMHLAAALKKTGVALFGPTDPARNGPYSSRLTTLRAPGAETTYKRSPQTSPSMRALTPDMVFDALRAALERNRG